MQDQFVQGLLGGRYQFELDSVAAGSPPPHDVPVEYADGEGHDGGDESVRGRRMNRASFGPGGRITAGE